MAATRLRTLGVSNATGRPYRFLSKAWDVEQAPWSEGSDGRTELTFRAPKLGEAAPTLFEQGVLFDDQRLRPEWTVFDLLGQVVDEIEPTAMNRPGSSTLDYWMLATLKKFRVELSKGLESATFAFDRDGVLQATVDRHLVDQVDAALAETPKPRRIRVVGKLDMLKLSDCLFQVVTEDGTTVRGAWDRETLDLKSLIGKDVLIEGEATYRANGVVLALRAAAARLATEADAIFRKVRTVGPSTSLRRGLRPNAGAFEAIVGKWPGDESDEEIDEFLREIS